MNRATQFAIVVFCVSLTVYALTLCPTIFWEDSAAFVTAAHTSGGANSFTATATTINSNGLDDDATLDIWQIDDRGTLTVVSNDIQS